MHKAGVPYSGRYGVSFRGEMIVENSRDPELDAARALLARGITGRLNFLDANTGKPRLILKDIEKAAKLTVREDKRRGPRFVKWQPLPQTVRQSGEGRSQTAETDQAGIKTPAQSIAALKARAA
ncbi:MAG: hypothetical protein WA441_10700 [Methyloceanibacter sp.]